MPRIPGNKRHSNRSSNTTSSQNEALLLLREFDRVCKTDDHRSVMEFFRRHYEGNYDKLADTFEIACINDCLVILKVLILLNGGAMQLKHRDDGQDAFAYLFRLTCMGGALNVAKYFYEIFSERINESTDYDTLFLDVCTNNSVSVAQWLLTIKPDIDIRTHNDCAFINACVHGNKDIADWLISLRPDFYSYENVFGKTSHF